MAPYLSLRNPLFESTACSEENERVGDPRASANLGKCHDIRRNAHTLRVFKLAIVKWVVQKAGFLELVLKVTGGA